MNSSRTSDAHVNEPALSGGEPAGCAGPRGARARRRRLGACRQPRGCRRRDHAARLCRVRGGSGRKRARRGDRDDRARLHAARLCARGRVGRSRGPRAACCATRLHDAGPDVPKPAGRPRRQAAAERERRTCVPSLSCASHGCSCPWFSCCCGRWCQDARGLEPHAAGSRTSQQCVVHRTR
jgi:hypothetical protein